MRLRQRKKMIDRQSLFNIRLGRFIAEFNQTIEEAYKSLDEVLETVRIKDDDEGQPDRP